MYEKTLLRVFGSFFMGLLKLKSVVGMTGPTFKGVMASNKISATYDGLQLITFAAQ